MKKSSENTGGKLTFGLKAGYAIGLMPESMLYNMFYTFFVIFLTNVAMISPIVAGTIALIALVWDCVIYPFVGYRSDISKDKRKYMINFIPMALTFMALFLNVGFSDTGKFFFYLIISMIFWLFYTLYAIPYYALVPEISDNYDERTQIRGISAWLNAFAILIGAGSPMLLVGLFTDSGADTATGWFYTAAAIGAVSLVFGLIATLSAKRIKLIKPVNTEAVQKFNIAKAYGQIIKLKPVKYIIVFALLFTVVTSLLSANLSYLVLYRIGAGAENVSLAMLVIILTMLVFVPIMVAFAKKTDRRIALIVAFAVTVCGCVTLKITGITSMPFLFALCVFTGISLSTFWAMIYPIAYDLVEVDEYVNGTRREGAIMAFVGLINKLGSAIGLWIIGAILTFVGYNAQLATQASSTALGIEDISTLVPAGLLFICLLAVIFYPLSKKAFNALQAELEKKRKGEATSTEHIKRIV